MSLAHLEGRTIEKIVPDQATIRRLRDSAAACLKDALVAELSEENRFDLAYKAIMQSATIALHPSGYRTPTNRPGHHQTLIQTLPLSLGLPAAKVVVLDSLRKQRNGIDYQADLVSRTMVDACIVEARELLDRVQAWLVDVHPELV